MPPYLCPRLYKKANKKMAFQWLPKVILPDLTIRLDMVICLDGLFDLEREETSKDEASADTYELKQN